MKKYQLILSILFLSVGFSQAQYIRCATAELHKKNMENNPQYRAYYENIAQKMHDWQVKGNQERSASSASTIVIPVVVHIVWNTPDQNISDAQVLSQIEVLNEDYSGSNANRSTVPAPWVSIYGNANLNFCLATRTPSGDYTTGIERKQTSVTSFDWEDESVKYDTAGGINGWDMTRYLNIWVCNMAGGLLGYTQMPGSPFPQEDGCVVLYSAFGRGVGPLLPLYNLGRTGTHEVGHWLGLFHVWGDDGDACSGTDYIMDTPDQSTCTYTCPAFPYIDACAHDTDVTGCPGDTVNGIMYMNYMDYSPDECMSMFTVDQVAVMHNILNTTRLSILTSNGCAAPAGIAEVNASTYIGLYPNPANNIINIDFRLPLATVLNVTAFDMTGKKLITTEVYKTGIQNINLDVSTLSSGLYMLVVNTDQGNIAKRFSIVR